MKTHKLDVVTMPEIPAPGREEDQKSRAILCYLTIWVPAWATQHLSLKDSGWTWWCSTLVAGMGVNLWIEVIMVYRGVPGQPG